MHRTLLMRGTKSERNRECKGAGVEMVALMMVPRQAPLRRWPVSDNPEKAKKRDLGTAAARACSQGQEQGPRLRGRRVFPVSKDQERILQGWRESEKVGRVRGALRDAGGHCSDGSIFSEE